MYITLDKITFTKKRGQVTLEVHIKGLTSENHSIYFHVTANCSSDKGKSAGDHWNWTFAVWIELLQTKYHWKSHYCSTGYR